MDNRKIIVLSYTVLSIVTWFLSRSFVQWLQASFYQVRRLSAITAIREALPLVLGLVTFAVLMKHPKLNLVMEEACSELKKVTWPNREDVMKATWVVLICIVVISSLLSVFDLIWGKLINYLLS